MIGVSEAYRQRRDKLIALTLSLNFGYDAPEVQQPMQIIVMRKTKAVLRFL